MMAKKKYIRTTQCQLRMLVDYMFLHQTFARGEYIGAVGVQNSRKEWEAVTELLRVHGADKTPEQWRLTWRDLKKRVREEASKFRIALQAGNVSPEAELSEMASKVLSIIGEDPNGSNLEPSEPKPKKPKSTEFSTVKKACVDLVKKHGYSVSLFDEEAFRTILQLLPLSANEKDKITSEYIQKYVELAEEEDDTAMSNQNEPEASDNEEESYVEPTVTIKGEVIDEPPADCNCGARASGDAAPGCSAHHLGCPAAARQPYWDYFEVTTDEATCHICGETLNWINITSLKEHLVEKHPTAEFVDDETEFARGPGSDVWSHDDNIEIYAEEDLYGDPPPPTNRKRKRVSSQPAAQPEQGADKSSGDDQPTRTKDQTRVEIEGLPEGSKKIIAMAADRFRCLDTFGQYVADLMKLIPQEKCLKFQVKIVQRLLQEQAAAG